MDNSLIKRTEKRRKRVLRVRKHLRGSAVKPRLCVMKSNKHLGVQLIDDEKGVTLAAASTVQKEYRGKKTKSKEAAKEIGLKIAHLAKEREIETIIFDRGRFKFHGLVAELANAAREAGLKF